ncbi:trypsin-like serine peptidase [Qingshengfaniella alkalisoli]|uniref:S1 family peptidase n=1 Tax=Qingshengfaniella alkalisoli TaxID=2599296 RepID=A0A5B8I9M5_9RHOB|nr:trypsin-like serine protease [Qingshengfaniella alkalisoli]QDY69716.1 S1 family peptidase [Qingshengfaniella alkalisoli]
MLLRVLFLCLLALPALAENSQRHLMTDTEQAEWPAVGRLNVGGQGHCTATLIAPDLVLTAAHCVYNRRTAAMWRPERLHFLPGYRKGDYLAHGIGAALIAPDCEVTEHISECDIILIRLAEPMPATIEPVPPALSVHVGDRVDTLSYGRDRSQLLSRQSDCRITKRRDMLLLTDCEATPGVSGAPLVITSPHGPKVAGVISAVIDAAPPAIRGDALAVSTDQVTLERLFQENRVPRGSSRSPLDSRKSLPKSVSSGRRFGFRYANRPVQMEGFT